MGLQLSQFPTFAEILKRPKTEIPSWVAPAIIPKNAKILIGGRAKIAKSTLALQLLKDITLGKNPFKHPEMTVMGNPTAVFMEREVGEYGMQDRIQKMFSDTSPELLGEKLRLFTVRDFKLDKVSDLLGLEEMLDILQPNILVIDPASKFMVGDDSSNPDVNHFFDAVDKLLERYRDLGLSIIITHHYGKPSRDPKTALEALDPYNFRGASKWFDDPDTIITCDRQLRPDWSKEESWYLNTRWTTRHAQQPKDVQLIVHGEQFGVRFNRFLKEDEGEEPERKPVRPQKPRYSQLNF